MARPEGFEPPTLCLEGRRSFQLSYGPSLPNFSHYKHLRHSLLDGLLHGVIVLIALRCFTSFVVLPPSEARVLSSSPRIQPCSLCSIPCAPRQDRATG